MKNIPYKYITLQFHKEAPKVVTGCTYGHEMNLAGEEREASGNLSEKKAIEGIEQLASIATRLIQEGKII